MSNIDILPLTPRGSALADELNRRILILDGAMGTMIQSFNLDEKDFRGQIFADSKTQLKGLNDLLVLTRPDVIESIHRQYIEAGADIIETDSFNSNAISLAEYGLADMVDELNFAAASLARKVADEFPGTFVAGSMGPTSKSLSMLTDIDENDATDFDSLAHTYARQASALIRGGVDALLIETVFDGLNAKAAVYGARQAMAAALVRVPIMISITLTEAGRTLSGQTIEALFASISHAHPLSIGLNCGFGAEGMIPYIETLDRLPAAVSLYPNAGLPNAMGQYDETPEMMVNTLKPYLSSGKLNIIGGCCGTTPMHIARLAEAAQNATPRSIPHEQEILVLAGLEALEVSPDRNFLNIGERCNVAGSRKFLRLVKENNLEEAEEIAVSQVESGAQVIDINMDDAMLDSTAEMKRFISRLSLRPDVARVPIMIDSSHWPTILAGLKRVQGRPVVNSISLKEGEEAFLDKATMIHELGAAIVVMAFDEKGQADTFERKTEVCGRAYRLLTEKAGIPGHDIIFDPNVLTIATGIEEHDNYALDFLRATEWIKANLPGAKVSGGISNLSFALRGNNPVREAMHALFLYHGIKRGLDMAIVNAGALPAVDDIPDQLRQVIDDVIFNRDKDATDRLITLASALKENATATPTDHHQDQTASLTTDQRIEQAVMRGSTDFLEPLLLDALKSKGNALTVIEGPLMAGMNRVGELFGQGKMFLPQVVKSARAMKKAVDILTPAIEASKREKDRTSSQTVILATVKGDVHDIGKNIVGVVMSCNGFNVVDLGVMVPAEDIVNRAIDENAAYIGLSGLITPSLEEMCHVAKLMEARGMTIPLLIGGATTSELHTAVKIAPCYSGPVIYTRDAAMLPGTARRFTDPVSGKDAIAELKQRQKSLRDSYLANSSPLLPLSEARLRRFRSTDSCPTPFPAKPGIHDLRIPVEEAAERINWRAFFDVWKFDPKFAGLAEITGCDHCRAQWLASIPENQRAKAAEAMQLFKEARRTIDHIAGILAPDGGIMARVAILPASSDEKDNILIGLHGEYITIPTLRQQTGSETCRSLSDYIRPIDPDGQLTDHTSVFAVTIGPEIQQLINSMQKSGDDYKALLYQSVADRLTEAATSVMHSIVHGQLWANGCQRGIRPAIGYPSLPDQSLIFITDHILHYHTMGIQLTGHGAMTPTASTTGLIFPHPDARYFSIGRISPEQLADYADRRNMPVGDLKAFLCPMD